MTSTNTVVATAPIDDWSRKFNNAKACNAGKAMVARRGRYWYYAWADGSQNGEEGPFQTEEQATIAAKQDGFKIANAAINAKIKVGDEVRVWQYPIRGQYGKVVKVGLMEYDVEVDGKVYPGIDYRMVVKMPAANACTSTNSVVRKAMAARRVARNARTDWEQEIYKLTERIKALVQKSQRENGDGYPTTVFKDALKAMRGY